MNKIAAFLAGEGKNVDLTAAIKWLNAAVIDNVGHSLREPEIVILKGTWRGLTYEQMSNGSEYSTNYLMRDVAPKLWKQLSHVFSRPVGKTNFRVALEAYVTANAAVEPELAAYGLSDPGRLSQSLQSRYLQDLSGSISSDTGLYWHPAVASDPRSGGEARAIRSDSRPANSASGSEVGYGSSLRPKSVPAPLYGYADELAQAKQWLSDAAVGTEGHSRLVGIWGLGGVGKTLLTETLIFQVGDQFDAVIWRSLQDRPTLQDLSSGILLSLGVTPQPTQVMAQLLAIMAQRSILLVVEGVEALLCPESLAGDYSAGYQTYGEFFKSAAGRRSCVVVTGIEAPAELRRQGGYGSGNGSAQSVRQITLGKLSERAATELLQAESLSAIEHWPALIERYQGHPLALKAAARVIREIFNGRVDEFLKQTSVLFTDILRLLAPSFERLSAPEVNILYWLASQEDPLSLADLQRTLPLSLSSAKLISALDSLKQRSLLEVQTTSEQPPTFYLPPLIKAYAVHQFMDQFSEAAGDVSAIGVQLDPPTGRQTDAFAIGQSVSSAPVAGLLYRQPGDKSSAPEPIINLSASTTHSVQLSPWFQGHFDADWHALNRLFASATRPAMRLRNTYHLRDETFVKRCKAISLGNPVDGSPAANAFLLVAVHQDGENVYKVCVQAQPAKESSVLPESLAIKLLDTQKNVLATVAAQQDDTFIQLPYFRGAISESFEIEVALGMSHHTETFVI